MRAIIAAIAVGLSPFFAVAAAAVAADSTTADPLAPQQIHDRIRRHRTTDATLIILHADGRPLANTTVTIRQTRHRFQFSNILFLKFPSFRSI